MEEKGHNYLNVYDICYSQNDNKKCANQKTVNGYCYRDIFSICGWFVEIIPNMLVELNKVNKGYPDFLCREFYQNNKQRIDINEEIFTKGYDKKYKDIYDECSDWCFNRWGEIIREMAFLFREYGEQCSQKNEFSDEYNKAQDEFDNKYNSNFLSNLCESKKRKLREIMFIKITV